MPVGPQRRSSYPNRVETPHGQVLSRKSDTAYTHAVVHTIPMAQHRENIQQHLEFHQNLIGKYGGDVEPHVHKSVQKLTKELGSLPETSHFSSLVSMHTGEEQARKRASRESGKGVGYKVVPVRQDD